MIQLSYPPPSRGSGRAPQESPSPVILLAIFLLVAVVVVVVVVVGSNSSSSSSGSSSSSSRESKPRNPPYILYIKCTVIYIHTVYQIHTHCY